jgi:outer membrane protein assembly factor BamB
MKQTLVLAALLALPAAAEDWPRFRGPSGQGISAEKGLPLRWSATENVAWRTPIPGEGWSSPIVWGDRVFLTTALEKGAACHVLCVSREDGKVLWNVKVFDQVTSRKEGRNSYATPTPVTDGRRVYAVFGSGGIAALDFEGKVAWVNGGNRHYSRHGLGASPLLHGELLIMPYDGSNRVDVPGQYPNNTPEERLGWQLPWDKSFVLGLDKETGKERWRAGRGMSRIAHVTPLVLEIDGKEQLVSPAGDVVQAFDPATGARLWTVRSPGEGVVPSPAAGAGLLFTASGFDGTSLRAVKLGGAKDDATSTHIAWEHRQNVPAVPSLLYSEPHLFAARDNGIVSCMDGRTGKVVWQQRAGKNFSASPVLAEGRIYLTGDSGETAVIEAAGEFREVARNRLADGEGPVQASMAVSGGRLFFRTASALWCIGK